MTSQDNGHWQYNGVFDVNDYEGFIYKVTFPSGHFYIGRRTFWNKVTKPPLKGKTRKRRSVKESRWRTYTSSSTHVNELITQLRASGDHSDILFEIIQLCKSKSEMSYGEVHHIIHSQSMTDPNGLNFQCPKVPCRPR